jgi:hypothetical protein
MRSVTIFILLLGMFPVFSQSKSITRFRSDFKENSNMFFYSSTLKMLNTENNPEIAEILDEIEEIRVLNYNRADQKFGKTDIAALKQDLVKETFNSILMINEKGNSVNVYNREKKGKTIGIVAIVENSESLVLIDLIGNIDVNKFLELKKKLETRSAIL